MIDSRANSPRFHREQQPFNASTASPNAATAAASAFNRRSSGNASLSAAAAAAALKARPHTPTNVAELQTKRTLRRSTSQSSSAGWSTPDTGGRPGHLRRQSSSGSMTERTFRSPSPGAPSQRSLSSGGIPRSPYQMDEPPPPVPALPASVNMEAAKKQGTRPKSLGITTTPVRTASQKMKDKDKGGPWFGAAKQGDMSNVRTSDAIISMSPTQMGQVLDEAERPESGEGSVNFSYPARVRLSSPTPSSPAHMRPEDSSPVPALGSQPKKRRSATMSPPRGNAHRSTRSSSAAQDQTLVYDANSRRMVPRADLLALEYKIQAASEAKPKTKKHTPTRAGSHLAKGTVGRPQGTAVDSGASNNAQLAAAASLRSHRAEERQPALPETEEQHRQPSPEAVPQPLAREPEPRTEARPVRRAEISTSPASNAPEVMPASQPQSTRPSVVQEETEESESEPEFQAPARVSTPPNASHALDSVPVRQNIYAHGVPSPPRSDLTEDQPFEGRDAPAELTAAPAQPSSDPSTSFAYEKKTGAEPRETQVPRRDPRTHSISPARTARFGTVQENLVVKHEPPPRSISPGKSVLKQQSPSRGASPTGVSDSSDANTAAQDSVTPSRKKSVRVSFDDDSTAVVGEAAGGHETDDSATPSSHATGKRPWYNNLGIGKKKDAPPLEDDEVMKPRPVLPTFGSIRGRKSSPQPTEERPLVRPLESSHGTSGLEGRAGDNVGQSSDHAVGGILHEQGPRNEANISKFREPLPPVVTSIEGNGYGSDSDSLDSESALMADTPRLESEESRVSDASTLVAEQSRRPNGTAEIQPEGGVVHVKDFAADPSTAVQHAEAGEVPTIEIIQPSPLPSERKQEQSSYVHFPGQFPETESEPDTDDARSQTKAPSPDNVPAPIRHVTFEPVVQKEDAKPTQQTPGTVLATQPAISEATDESDGSSVYSDAYEDLSEIEGDGFQSLDAVLDSPLVITPPKSVFQRSPAQRPDSVTSTPTGKASQNAIVALAPEQQTGKPIGDWEAAKAYWRSLTADRRAQLETEAAEEAGAEGDLEESKQASKPRRKKSMEKRNAEKKAREQQRATVDPERIYMIKPGTKADEFHPPMTEPPRGKPASGKEEPRLRLRKSMRGAQAQPVEQGTGMRKSLRSEGPGQTKARQRPASYQPSLGATSETAAPNKHSRSVSEGQPASSIDQPKLRRRGSDSSASSFKRARATSQGFAFRKTMRTGPNPADESRDQQSSRFSVRSMSPPVSTTGGMRTTLRGDPKFQRRASQDSGKGYLRFSGSFGQKSRGKKASRFGDDSSDEDVPHRFASRFEDSSDEDVAPQPLPPVTIAKTMRGGKAAKKAPSPPLPEEDEELSGEDADGRQGAQAVALGSGGVPRSQTEPSIRQNRSGRGVISTTAASGDDDGRPSSRRGFMSSVLRRNKKRGGAITRAGPAESAARRDTNLERSTDELNAIRSGSGGGGSIRLQKRTASGPAGSSNWPLPGNAAEEAASDEEPEQAAGGRSFSDEGTIDTNAAGKKKRFGALRRMLKIDD